MLLLQQIKIQEFTKSIKTLSNDEKKVLKLKKELLEFINNVKNNENTYYSNKELFNDLYETMCFSLSIHKNFFDMIKTLYTNSRLCNIDMLEMSISFILAELVKEQIVINANIARFEQKIKKAKKELV